MSEKKKRTGASAVVGRNPRAGNGQTRLAAQRNVITSQGQSLSTSHGKLIPTHLGRPKSDVTDDVIRKVVATARVDQLLVMLRERIIKENGREILEFLTLKGEQAKLRIENESGPSLSTEKAGEVIGKSSETVRGYIRNNLLAGYTAANDRTKLRLPAWQFDGSEIHEWVPRLIEAFGENGWPLLDFVTVERVSRGKNYLDLLREGEIEPVIAAAKRANPN